jgi:hypothetical protein
MPTISPSWGNGKQQVARIISWLGSVPKREGFVPTKVRLETDSPFALNLDSTICITFSMPIAPDPNFSSKVKVFL